VCGILISLSLSLQDVVAKHLRNIANSAYMAVWCRNRIPTSSVFIRLLIMHVNLVQYLLFTVTRPLVRVYRFNIAGPSFPIATCVYPCYVAYHEGRYKTFVQQIGLGRAFLPSPWTHTFDIGITYSPGQLIFQNTKTKIHSRRQLAVLLLHCELHKLYRKWQANAGNTTLTGEPSHEDHSWEKRTWRTETHCCQRGELEPVVLTSLQPSILEERMNWF
jgi:hypothetical protein